MAFFKGVLAALTVLSLHSADPARVPDGTIYEACGQDPYLKGKHGFPDIHHAKNHAYKEFKKDVRSGRINPTGDEYFCYLYTLAGTLGHPPVFFHSQWKIAPYEKTENGSERHLVHSPYAETDGVNIYSLMHNHPSHSQGGAGPSRVDVATASKYRNPDGTFRYLYLINNRGHLLQFKARRHIDLSSKAQLLQMPVQPRVTIDWLD